MAIKISGSTIIDDSRSLVNVGVSTISALNVSGNINANGNIIGDNSTNISGISSVTATSYFGNGENLTGVGFKPDADENLFAGTDAGSNLDGTSGCFNVFLGACAGKAITSGADNVFLGRNAGLIKQTTACSIFIGQDAGCVGGTGGTRNTVIGARSGLDMSSSNNVVIGSCSLTCANYGSGTVSVGHQAGKINSSGDNTFVGCGAGKCNKGQFVTIIGRGAGEKTCNGNFNVFVGSYAAEGNGANNSGNTGKNNTYIGHKAGRCLSTGQYNSFFGSEAGCSNTDGNYNVFLGACAGNTNTSGNYNIAIGHDIELPSATGSCQFVIGKGTSCWVRGDNSFNVCLGGTALQVCSNTGAVYATTFHGSGANLTNLPGFDADSNCNLIAGHCAGTCAGASPSTFNIIMGCGTGCFNGNGEQTLY